jgi:erythromycin esterase
MIKKTISILALIIPLLFYSQNKETINWITYNSITIEDANSELMIFLRKTYLINLIIQNLWVWGSIHNTKEFFNLKLSFKHLVKNQGEKFYNGRILSSRIWHK